MQKSSNAKVLLGLYGGVIAAHDWTYFESENDTGIAAQCDDGTTVIYANTAHPTSRQFYDITVSDVASYQEKREAVIAATGLSDPRDEFPWIEYDDEGQVIPETDTDETLTIWLNSKIPLEDLEYWGARGTNQYAPGFSLAAALTSEEQKDLGIDENDISGSPASSVLCVSTTATIDRLNRVLSTKGLPFLFVEELDEEPDPGYRGHYQGGS